MSATHLFLGIFWLFMIQINLPDHAAP